MAFDPLESRVWVPKWPAPARVRAAMSTRIGGYSAAPFDSCNLGSHVGDDAAIVEKNREQLAGHLSAKLVFLDQVHGSHCELLTYSTPPKRVADSCVTQQLGLACTAMVADCLPVLLCDSVGNTVGAAHAGWRGLSGTGNVASIGVLPKFLSLFRSVSDSVVQDGASGKELYAWLGPCIGSAAFVVGAEVRAAFLDSSAHFPAAEDCFERFQNTPSQYRCDLAALARLQLRALGVSLIYGNDSTTQWCTFSGESFWFSHRRDAAKFGSTGRMAACIWLD